MSWFPINDFPGDQQYDGLPDEHWGEIGRDGRPDKGEWSWTIVTIDEHGSQWEVAVGYTATEDEAKAAVEGWRP